MPLPVLAAFLCLDQKYDICGLYNDARKRLFQRFPCDFHLDEGCWEGGGLKVSPNIHPNVDLLNIARRAGVISILPHLLYQCCSQYTPSEIKNGTDPHNGPVRRLSHGDQTACLAGLYAIYDAQADTTYRWLHKASSSSDCVAPSICEAARHRYLSYAFTRNPPIAGLHQWNTHDDYYEMHHLCKHCSGIAKSEHEAGRQAFWDRLPSLFDLPSWDELLKEREDMYVFDNFCTDAI